MNTRDSIAITKGNVNKEVFGIVGVTSFDWCINQKPCVQKLWFESWRVDCFGDRWVELKTSLPSSTFRQARKSLKEAGLFDFRTDTNSTDNRKTSRWLVRNLKGSKSHLFNQTTSQEIDASLLAANCDIPPTENIDASLLALSAHSPALNASLLAGNSPQTLTPQDFQNPSLISQEYTNKLNQEKEINNTNTLYENKYIKPDLDPARVREGENKKPLRFEEATLNATPLIDTQKELPKHLSVVPEYIPTSELSAIAKSKYGDKLPEIKPGLSRKSIRINEAGLTKLYILHLFDAEAKAVQSILDRNNGSYSEVKSFLAECSDLVVAVFTFVGKDLAQFSLCG